MSYQALLFCPEEKTARVVTQVLTELDFTVDPCNEPFGAVKKMMAKHFDAVVVDCENEQNATLLFKSARTAGGDQNSLSVALVEGQAGVAKAFRIGANLVLTKPINVEQSKGTLRVARGLLRKSDAGKPAGQSGPAQPHAPSMPTPVPASLSGVPSARSAFDLEQEAGPQPDAADAAVLESMPDPISAMNKIPAPSVDSKPYPWQPVSQPSEPMSSALRSAAEATGAAAATNPAQSETASTHALASQVPSVSTSSGQGAAAAPAPAKETPKSKIVPLEPRPVRSLPPDNVMQMPGPARSAEGTTTGQVAAVQEIPSFAGYSAAETRTKTEQSSKRPLLIVAMVLLVAAAGYYGWTRLHPGTQAAVPKALIAKPIMPTAPVSQAVTPVPQAAASTPQLTITPSSPQPTSAQESPAPKLQISAEPAPAKPLPAKTAHNESGHTAENDEITLQEAPEPLMVKRETGLPKPAVQPPQPELQAPTVVPADSDAKALAGIVGKPDVAIPRVAPQSVRISQGVSQGLLVKRVQPVYPQQALMMHLAGVVQLDANIAKDGSVSKVQVASGDPILARAATDAVRQWKYKPYLLNGAPVDIQTQITVSFKLP